MKLPATNFARPFGLLTLAAGILAFSAPVVLASQNECGTRSADIIRKAYPSAKSTSDGIFEVGGETIKLPTDSGDDTHAMICRIWPARPELTLVAVPLMREQSDDGNEGDIELLVVDSDSLDLKARLRLPKLMSDDAVFVSGVAFDTARYHLAPGKTAFGLRLSLQGSSRPNPFGETALWLFLLDDDALKPVLDNIVVAEGQGEWDTNCAGEFHDTARTLSMSRSAQRAFADIVVSEKKTTTISTPDKDGECVDKKQTTIGEYRLRYEGASYCVPKELQRME
ncbi:hypothetical protein [Shinella sp.]|uniref:hypothetical protein n=1 Tax=Shinella sp. TaxID=1870904 RepID=UPI003F6E77B8